MNFKTYLNQSWNDHPTQAEKIATEFSIGASLVESNEELSQLVSLVTHVMGEHLARWADGIRILSNLKTHPAFEKNSETEKAILRSIAALQVGAEESPDLKLFSRSDHVRILAVASSALADRKSTKAQGLLLQALSLAEMGLDKNDPANRALAVTGNNLACALEEKKGRSKDETELMILASQSARKFWERAGGWLEVSRAEYRLAMTYLEAGELPNSFRHAQACVELCRENHAGDVDLFFAYEALALVEKRKENQVGFEKAVNQAKVHFEKLGPDDKSWCEPSLKKLIELE